MKAARRPSRRRKALLPSLEKLHTRLALVEEAQGLRTRKAFVFMPQSRESKFAEFPESEGPQRGDLVIYFEPLFDTAAEAQLTVEAFRDQACAKSSPDPRPLPWKRTLAAPDPPQRGRDPDAELEGLAEERKAPDIRPLTEGELQDAARGLLQTGNLFRRGVVRDALAGGQVPLSDSDRYPCPEFGVSDRGTVLFRMRRSAARVDRWRAATDGDKDRWSTSFRAFCEEHIAALDRRLVTSDEGNEGHAGLTAMAESFRAHTP
ncbi:MAG: hypothetical protein EHM78_19375 [Myxococcaceae bacterium]|nr:MAG: hypothetical protein EHM78_19375 [Myxococcaceae bacterium]